MPIPIVSEFRPSNDQKFAIVEDVFIRGGLFVAESFENLSAVHPSRLKSGMVAVIPDLDSDRLRSFRLESDLLTWTPCFLGDKGDKGDKGEKGDKGDKGLDGIRGAAFRYEDFTPQQLAGLKGEKGDTGDAFTFDDFTPAQLASLKGEKGDAFVYSDFTPAQLASIKGEKGDKGDAFKYSDFTPDQLAAIKGDKGDKGNAFVYADFTPAQLAALKGEKGDKGDGLNFDDLTPEQIAAIKGVPGDKGDPFVYSDFTPAQLAALKGDPFTYADLTPAQLAALKGDKGDKGDAFKYSDFTPAQLAALKGEPGQDGQDGAAFTYADFTPAQLAGLKGEKGDAFTPTAQDWDTYTPYKRGVLRLDVDSGGNPQVYKALVSNTSTVAPKDDPTNWTPVQYLDSTQVSALVTSTLNANIQHTMAGAHDLLKAGSTCYRTKLTQRVSIPAGAAGSNLFCEVAATVASTVDVIVNGSVLFSFDVAVGATVGTLINTPAETILNVGDTVIIRGGATCNLLKMAASVLAYAEF